MRNWTLGPGDPLALWLAADFRLCTPDYINDQIWEFETGGVDPPALALHTTYGLRARAMRIFPRFSLGSQKVTDPSVFFLPPRLRHFFPNFLQFDFKPFPNIDVVAEYWVPGSNCSAGRFTVTNCADEKCLLHLEICAQLAPLDGQSLAPLSLHSVNILSGRTSNLAPVIFLTGGPQPGPGPYPSLALELALDVGSSRSLTWVHAALENQSDSFELARHTAARPWDAERARLEQINASQTVEVHTGDPDWDAALAFSQKAAFSLFFCPGPLLPYPSFVNTRQPDNGYSPRGNGADYPPAWSGQAPLEAWYLAGLLPGAPELAAGLIRNFLSVQDETGAVNGRPGLAGQRGRWLAAPLLASLAWQTYRSTLDKDFLREIQPRLNDFINCWFSEVHDRDRDGFPEWEHALQTGLEDAPSFTIWQAGGQGAAISAAESPALSAMLFKETLSLAKISGVLGQPEESQRLEAKAEELRLLTEQCWDDPARLYHYRDRDSHASPAGKIITKHLGGGTFTSGRSFRHSMRLLVRIDFKGESTRRPRIVLRGQEGEIPISEQMEHLDFQWGTGLAVATSRSLFTQLDEVEITGVEKRDRVSVQIMDFSNEDISLFLPLWAGLPAQERTRELVDRALLAPDRFGKPFGFSTCAPISVSARSHAADADMDLACRAVHLPWNTLVGEGLLAYGLRETAAQITTRLMAAVIQNLKKHHAFFRSYHSETGAGIGERNPLQGLAPLGLFLDTLGVEIQSEKRVALSGMNPFPWPVTVKYRSLTVRRQAQQTIVVFPDGQTLTLNDPTDAVVSAE